MNKFYKNLSLSLAIMSVSSLFAASPVSAAGWVQHSGIWYYEDYNGYYVTGWKYINSKWYYFNGSGKMLTGWIKDAGTWYYLNSDGDMRVGWLQEGSTWYYLKSDGAMACNETLKIGGVSYKFNSSGAWVEDKASSTNGWVQSGSTWYYYNSSGNKVTGWQKLQWQGKTDWYYFNSNGSMKTGWLQDNGIWYYLKSSGAMACNETLKVDGTNYSFDSSGAWIKGNVGSSTIVSLAQSKIGKPYVYGAAGPNSFDCSGLVYWCYRQLGRTVPRTAASLASAGTGVSRYNAQPGDIIVLYSYGHCGIYIGNNQYIHAPEPGDVVKISSVPWGSVNAIRRI